MGSSWRQTLKPPSHIRLTSTFFATCDLHFCIIHELITWIADNEETTEEVVAKILAPTDPHTVSLRGASLLPGTLLIVEQSANAHDHHTANAATIANAHDHHSAVAEGVEEVVEDEETTAAQIRDTSAMNHETRAGDKPRIRHLHPAMALVDVAAEVTTAERTAWITAPESS